MVTRRESDHTAQAVTRALNLNHTVNTMSGDLQDKSASAVYAFNSFLDGWWSLVLERLEITEQQAATVVPPDDRETIIRQANSIHSFIGMSEQDHSTEVWAGLLEEQEQDKAVLPKLVELFKLAGYAATSGNVLGILAEVGEI